jgi:hypothetical protein
MMKRSGYLEEYVAFWNARPEVNRIWISLYSPQVGEQAPEILTPEERLHVAQVLPGLRQNYPKLLMSPAIAGAILEPPKNPQECLFSKLSTNYSADLTSRVEPCIFGGTPDCSQCGCVISSGLHSLQKLRIVGPLRIGHLVRGSMAMGSLQNKLWESAEPSRWRNGSSPQARTALVQIDHGS